MFASFRAHEGSLTPPALRLMRQMSSSSLELKITPAETFLSCLDECCTSSPELTETNYGGVVVSSSCRLLFHLVQHFSAAFFRAPEVTVRFRTSVRSSCVPCTKMSCPCLVAAAMQGTAAFLRFRSSSGGDSPISSACTPSQMICNK